MRLSLLSSVLLAGASSVLADPSISSFPNSLTLSTSFDPIIGAYWTGLPHHRRTPFSVSPDGKSAYVAYLDSTKKNVVVQQVDTTTFTAVGTAATIPGYEAAGLVAQNDGFALMATIDPAGTTDLPPNDYHIVGLIRYKNGAEAWRTPLNGPGVHPSELTASPDANGDLVYSAASGLYGAYFVVTAYSGSASGHFGDSIQYVNDNGALQDIASSSVFGCSHNTGIGIEAADAPPFATICAEDTSAIWLNTDTQYMSGVKIANENTTNGVSGEPMGGMSGSYSNLALFPGSTKYVFGWQSRGAVNLARNDWLGDPYTQCYPRWLNHNVAIATMSSKNKLTGPEASSVVGGDGDAQVNWITKSETEDHQNVHVAAINSNLALVTWETLASPTCQPVPLSCTGTYTGTSFQIVDSAGAKVGAAVVDTKVFVSGDIVNIGTDKVCWPYVDMTWDLSQPKSSGTAVTKLSFACASTGATAGASSPVASTPATSSPVLSSTKQGVVSSSKPATTPATVQPTTGPLVQSTFSQSATAQPTTGPLVQPSPATPNSSLVPVESAPGTPTVSVPAASQTSSAGGVIATPSVPSSTGVPAVTGTVAPTGGLPSGTPTGKFPSGGFPPYFGTRTRSRKSRPTTFATSVKPAPTAPAEDESCEA